MSTVFGAKAGKDRSAFTNIFTMLLVLTLLVFGLNFYFGAQRNTDLGDAPDSVTRAPYPLYDDAASIQKAKHEILVRLPPLRRAEFGGAHFIHRKDKMYCTKYAP